MRSAILTASLLLCALVLSPTRADAKKPQCGDGVASAGEACDGADLKGATCASLGYPGGTLTCAGDCAYDVSGCATAARCGDGVADGFEECDRADDFACPGRCSGYCACPSLPAGGPLEAHVIDVGQGDAILIVSPDGFTMLVDAGEDWMGSAVSAYLAALGVPALDYVLATHTDSDHLGAMDLILAEHPEVVVAFDNGSACATVECADYVTAAGDRRTTLFAGDSIDLGPSLTVDVLHSDMGAAIDNDNSVVFRVAFGALRFLFGGDCEIACEASFDPGPIDLYKGHHHGSDTSSSEALLQQMAPYTALIPVGAGNPYGHPVASVLDRFAAHDVDVFRTDLDGDLLVLADGVSYTVNGAPVCLVGETRACGDSDVGVCQLGTRACESGMWGACAGAVYPMAEDCGNGLDDDCDGLVDGADPSCAAGPESVLIAQVGYDTPGDDALEEFVDLYNPTPSAIDISGWTLADNASTWTFPTGTTVAAGAYLSVARSAAGFAALYGKDPDVTGLGLGLGNTGDGLSLADPIGEVDFVAWEGFAPGWDITAATGDSIERVDPTVDTDVVADFAVTSPAAPRGGAATPCGNGVCDPGEDCLTCPSDCPGITSGKPNKRFCCGNGVCESAFEDISICALDCAP